MSMINFIKVVASGNDFILIDIRKKSARLNLEDISKRLCQRTMGIGADGLLVLEKSKKADVRMRIFNADGSEAEMCGNGARCVAYFVSQAKKKKRTMTIDTKAGIVGAWVRNDMVKINTTQPHCVKIDFSITINHHALKVNFINTGVPHVVILCENINEIDVLGLGRLVRNHRRFQPAGTNVNFVEPRQLDTIRVRTYERGVEAETLACGTGSVASAIVYAIKLKNNGIDKKNSFSIFVDTVSGEKLKVSFDFEDEKIKNVFLEGKAKIVCQGECYV